MTTRQIKKLIYRQANFLCIIGIPIGMVLGYLLSTVLVPIIIIGIDTKAFVSVNFIVFLISALFAWLTVLVSCMRPARLAGKVSPIEALRYTDIQSNSKKTTKRGRNSATLLGMAWANLGRNKKRTITVICSLTLGLVLLSCFYANTASFDMEKYLSSRMVSDFSIEDASNSNFIEGYNPYGTTITENLISQINALEGLEAVGRVYTNEEAIP